jgi:hypothetical protein
MKVKKAKEKRHKRKNNKLNPKQNNVEMYNKGAVITDTVMLDSEFCKDILKLEDIIRNDDSEKALIVSDVKQILNLDNTTDLYADLSNNPGHLYQINTVAETADTDTNADIDSSSLNKTSKHRNYTCTKTLKHCLCCGKEIWQTGEIARKFCDKKCKNKYAYHHKGEKDKNKTSRIELSNICGNVKAELDTQSLFVNIRATSGFGIEIIECNDKQQLQIRIVAMTKSAVEAGKNTVVAEENTLTIENTDTATVDSNDTTDTDNSTSTSASIVTAVENNTNTATATFTVEVDNADTVENDDNNENEDNGNDNDNNNDNANSTVAIDNTITAEQTTEVDKIAVTVDNNNTVKSEDNSDTAENKTNTDTDNYDSICPICNTPFRKRANNQIYDTAKCKSAAKTKKAREKRQNAKSEAESLKVELEDSTAIVDSPAVVDHSDTADTADTAYKDNTAVSETPITANDNDNYNNIVSDVAATATIAAVTGKDIDTSIDKDNTATNTDKIIVSKDDNLVDGSLICVTCGNKMNIPVSTNAKFCSKDCFLAFIKSKNTIQKQEQSQSANDTDNGKYKIPPKKKQQYSTRRKCLNLCLHCRVPWNVCDYYSQRNTLPPEGSEYTEPLYRIADESRDKLKSEFFDIKGHCVYSIFSKFSNAQRPLLPYAVQKCPNAGLPVGTDGYYYRTL